MRSFIAIPLPDEIRKGLGELQNQLREFNADIGWVQPHGIHLTLKFLGEISETQIPSIQSCIEEISKKSHIFNLEIEGTGVFPDTRRPRVLWVGITSGMETLQQLANEIEEALEKLGIPREDRKFNPHLTLGRVRSSKNMQPLILEFFDKMNPHFGRITVNQIVLYQSILKPNGAEYKILFEASIK